MPHFAGALFRRNKKLFGKHGDSAQFINIGGAIFKAAAEHYVTSTANGGIRRFGSSESLIPCLFVTCGEMSSLPIGILYS